MNPAIHAAETLDALRRAAPLVHNITNFVTMNFVANALLSLGASPVMAHAPEEVAEMTGLAGALCLNIGTLTESWVSSMITAGRMANLKRVPVVLDPVGAGATHFRTEMSRKILDAIRVKVVRGNASEVLALDREQGSGGTRGVDSLHSVDEAAQAGKALANRLHTTLAVTGAVDLITDGTRVFRVANGHPLMTRITGAGCVATSLIAAFCAVDPDPVTAAALALACFGLAGERAAATAAGPGTFLVHLLDALHNLTPDDLGREARIEAA